MFADCRKQPAVFQARQLSDHRSEIASVARQRPTWVWILERTDPVRVEVVEAHATESVEHKPELRESRDRNPGEAIPIEGPVMLMEEALICLKERAGGKLMRAFLEIARKLADT